MTLAIAEYHCKINRIAELEEQVEQLELKVLKETKNKNQIKRKYEELKKKYVPKYRGNKDIALELIAQYHDKKDITLIQISRKTKLAYSTVRGYSCEYLKGLLNEKLQANS